MEAQNRLVDELDFELHACMVLLGHGLGEEGKMVPGSRYSGDSARRYLEELEGRVERQWWWWYLSM